jgi:hypothetical protein
LKNKINIKYYYKNYIYFCVFTTQQPSVVCELVCLFMFATRRDAARLPRREYTSARSSRVSLEDVEDTKNDNQNLLFVVATNLLVAVTVYYSTKNYMARSVASGEKPPSPTLNGDVNYVPLEVDPSGLVYKTSLFDQFPAQLPQDDTYSSFVCTGCVFASAALVLIS